MHRILVLAPHTDDEFGCAGTMARLASVGHEIRYLALSGCEDSVPQGLPPDTLRNECCRAMSQLGVPQTAVEILRFPVRHFPAHRQEILQCLVDLNKRFAPDAVFVPATCDVHQDHQVTTAEAERAFKYATLLGYELPWNCRRTSSFQVFVAIDEAALAAKVAALDQYVSQSNRTYMDPGYIRAVARVRGVQAGTELAEAFECIRVIWRR